MTYPRDDRITKLNYILTIQSKDEKRNHLKNFISEEIRILKEINKHRHNEGTSPLKTTEALKKAESELNILVKLDDLLLHPLALTPRQEGLFAVPKERTSAFREDVNSSSSSNSVCSVFF